MNLSKITVVPLSFVVVVVALSGCATSGPKETAKLVSHVEDSRRALQVAEAQLRTTFETANALDQTERGNLQSDFQRLNSEIKLSHEKLEDFRKSIAAMDKISASYFTARTAELDKYETEEFRVRGETQLKETRGRYDQVLTAMQQVQDKFNPFIAKLHDLSLYLNYNLSPTGVASIKENVDAINYDATGLYTAIDAAVRQADVFADSMAP